MPMGGGARAAGRPGARALQAAARPGAAQRLGAGTRGLVSSSRRSRVAVQCMLPSPKDSDWLHGWLKSEGINDETIDRFVEGAVAAGLGAMVVTATFVAMGQDPFHAMKVTAFATIAALVLDEVQNNQGEG